MGNLSKFFTSFTNENRRISLFWTDFIHITFLEQYCPSNGLITSISLDKALNNQMLLSKSFPIYYYKRELCDTQGSQHLSKFQEAVTFKNCRWANFQ